MVETCFSSGSPDAAHFARAGPARPSRSWHLATGTHTAAPWPWGRRCPELSDPRGPWVFRLPGRAQHGGICLLSGRGVGARTAGALEDTGAVITPGLSPLCSPEVGGPCRRKSATDSTDGKADVQTATYTAPHFHLPQIPSQVHIPCRLAPRAWGRSCVATNHRLSACTACVSGS